MTLTIHQDKPELADVVTSSGLVMGRKYFVRYQSRTPNQDLEACLIFLDEDPHSFYFSLRYQGGTQVMPKSWVKVLLQAPEHATLYAGKEIPKLSPQKDS